MPATRTTASRSRAASAGAKKKPTAAQRTAAERCEQNGRVIERVSKSLEAAQADLSALRGSVGTGAADLRKDVAHLLRDARRDLTKMSKTVRRDLERAQRDLTAAARSGTGKPAARSRRGARTSTASKSRSRGAAR
jgi:hypothetical protein